MAAIEISDELASQIEYGAQRAGQSRVVFLSKAISSYTEDLEYIDSPPTALRILASESRLDI